MMFWGFPTAMLFCSAYLLHTPLHTPPHSCRAPSPLHAQGFPTLKLFGPRRVGGRSSEKASTDYMGGRTAKALLEGASVKLSDEHVMQVDSLDGFEAFHLSRPEVPKAGAQSVVQDLVHTPACPHTPSPAPHPAGPALHQQARRAAH
eukprot:356499-Chlamydomonas_euryale.AAC.8